MNKKAILCIIDGLTDESFSLSKLPQATLMAQVGAYGCFDTVPPGFEVESYPCIASLLGVRVEALPPLARGYIDALGVGITVDEDDLVFRASWLTVADDGVLFGMAPAPLVPPPLPPDCDYYHFGGYKALLILRGLANKLPYIKTFAPHACLGRRLEQVLPSGEPRLTELVRLSKTSKGVLLPWGQATACRLPEVGCRAAAVGAAPVFMGLAQAMNFDVYTEPGFIGDIGTDLFGKAQLALKLAEEYPLVVLHVNGADEAAHRCDAIEKQMFVNLVGEKILKPLLKAKLPLLVCADHGTSPVSGRHVGGLQPFVLVEKNIHGDLGELPANAALKLLLGE